jgi:UDP-2-acetamido-2,6-beta-L-arabino-hexul-4-ose reductase
MAPPGMRIAVSGADGFIGRNLVFRLSEAGFEPLPLRRSSSEADWHSAIAAADAVVSLAGVNRPPDPAGFAGNVAAAEQLVRAIEAAGRPLPILHASSIKAAERTPYGESKREAEDALLALAERSGAPVAIFRLPNVFGKWSRPNYNSMVATFCHNIARGLPIEIHDAAAAVDLVYVDDVVDAFIARIGAGFATGFDTVAPAYRATVGALAETIRGFRADRDDNRIDDVGTGFTRALYATYISFLPPSDFARPLVAHGDARGTFSEMLRTRHAGQFSFFTAHPGVTRGGHYHHSKTEKFLVVHGKARFRFRHMLTGETHEVETCADEPVVVDTIPGWTHDITNVGDGELACLLWANEIFDRGRPDTIAEKV